MSSPRATYAATTVFVRGLVLEAEIGVNANEQGQPQPLVVDIEAELSGEPWRGFSETVDYERLAGHARMIAAAGHIGLVETFAWRLLDEERVAVMPGSSFGRQTVGHVRVSLSAEAHLLREAARRMANLATRLSAVAA